MSANTRFKTETALLVVGDGTQNSDFYTNVNITGQVNVTGSLFYISGNLVVGGNLNYQGTSVVNGALIPQTDQLPLGNTSYRFDGYFYDVYIYDALIPANATGILLGNSSNRWLLYAQNVDANGTLTISGNVVVNTAALVVDSHDLLVGVNTGIGSLTNTFTVTGTIGATGNVYTSGTLAATGNVTANAVTAGNTVFVSNNASVTNTSQNLIDSWPKTASRAAKYWVCVTQSTSNDVQGIEFLVVHDTNTLAVLTLYGEISTKVIGTFGCSINNANVEAYFTAGVANTYVVKTTRMLIN